MEAQTLVDNLLEFLSILLSWPVVFLFIVMYFRKEICKLLPELSRRLTKASIGGNILEFSDVEIKAFKDAIDSGTEQLKDKPEELAKFVKEQVRKLPETSLADSIHRSPFSRRTILWVDDNPTNNYYESNILKELGACIDTTTSTKDTKDALESRQYDLIISDIHRTENGKSNPNAGYELLEYMQKKNIKIPLIFYTGNVNRADALRARNAFGVADNANSLIILATSALS